MKAGDALVIGMCGALVGAALVFGCASGPAELVTDGVPNLSQVGPAIFRGGQPSAQGWQYLRTLGLTNDVKLNTQDEASDRGAVQAGFRCFYFPIDTESELLSGPDAGTVRGALAAIRPGTFIHCEHGRDRTGLIVGLYRLQQGSNAATAWYEMTNHGYHPAMKGLTRYWESATRSNSLPPP